MLRVWVCELWDLCTGYSSLYQCFAPYPTGPTSRYWYCYLLLLTVTAWCYYCSPILLSLPLCTAWLCRRRFSCFRSRRDARLSTANVKQKTCRKWLKRLIQYWFYASRILEKTCENMWKHLRKSQKKSVMMKSKSCPHLHVASLCSKSPLSRACKSSNAAGCNAGTNLDPSSVVCRSISTL